MILVVEILQYKKVLEVQELRRCNKLIWAHKRLICN